MRIRAARILRGKAPNSETIDFATQKRGRCYTVTWCGVAPTQGGMSLEVTASGRVTARNVMRCGSVWTCAECADRIAVRRAYEITTVIERALATGCRVELATFTLPHSSRLSATTCFRRLKESLNAMSSDGTAARALKRLGFLGQVRAIEVTHTEASGWHFHAHAVLVFEPDTKGSEGTAQDDWARSRELKKALFPVWSRVAERTGSRRPTFEHGMDVRVVWSANDYLSKMPQAGRNGGRTRKSDANPAETTRIDTMRGDRGPAARIASRLTRVQPTAGRTPWEILEDAEHDPSSARLFEEYAKATWGSSQIEWSKRTRNLRKLFLNDGEAKSDEALVYDEAVIEPRKDETEHGWGQEHLVVEIVQIAASDAWRSRRENFGSIDRAVLAVEREEAFSLARSLSMEGWQVIERCPQSRGTALIKDRNGYWRERNVLLPAEHIAIWPSASCSISG